MRVMEAAMIQTRAARAMGLFALATFVVVMLVVPPFSQDQSYHDFAGPRMPVVASNVAFLLAALAGFAVIARVKSSPAVITFFAGTLATALGSTYYHLAPNDDRLVYDRLGMIICFGAIVAMLLEEQLGVHILPLLLLAGVASIVWWRQTGDLRPYGFVQFFPMLVIVGLLAFTRARFTHRYLLVIVAGLYGAAKALELFDRQVYAALGVSGHTLKHIVAGAATGVVAWWIAVRRPVLTTTTTT